MALGFLKDYVIYHFRDEEEYQALWRTFHETAAIPERANALCQRTHLPLRYRPYMTEFQKGNLRGI